MSNLERAEANRLNARRSTGPRTREGKAGVRLNALKHGVLAKDALLPGEDAAVFSEFAEAIAADLRPIGMIEQLLTEAITAAFWRLRRAARIEAGALKWGYFGALAERALARARACRRDELKELTKSLEGTVLDQGQYEAASAQATEATRCQAGDDTAMSCAFAMDAVGPGVLERVSRYEAALDRRLLRALHELQRLQAARKGAAVPAPVAVDLTVAGEGDHE